HQLGVKAPVVRVVNLLGHKAIKRWADRRGRMVNLNGQRRRLGDHGGWHEGQHKRREDSVVHDLAILLRQPLFDNLENAYSSQRADEHFSVLGSRSGPAINGTILPSGCSVLSSWLALQNRSIGNG